VTAGGSNPFEALFNQLGRMLSTEGPVNWELARQFALWTAAEGEPESNVDPLERMRLEELVRVADLHIADVTGLATSSTGRPVTVRPVGRGDWAVATLEAWRPLLSALTQALAGPAPAPEANGEDQPFGAEGGWGQMLGSIMPGLQAAFLGMQCGSMVGSLALEAFGQYDLPVPRPPGDLLLVVAENVARFASDWSLPADDVRLWICLSEVAHHAVLIRPHVGARLQELLIAYVSAFDPSAASLEDRLADLDPSDPESLQRALGDPGALISEIQSDQQRGLLPPLEALVAAVEGYVDHVVDVAGGRLIGSHGPLTEAFRRLRVERGQGGRMVERLLGLELRQAQYERGAAFVRGVVERAGEDGLARLWSAPEHLPTPAEVDAPGLWLERISYSGG